MNYEKRIYRRLIIAIGIFLPLLIGVLYGCAVSISDQATKIASSTRRSLLVERLQFFNVSRAREIPVYMINRNKAELVSYNEFYALFNQTFAQVRELEHDQADLLLLDKIKSESENLHSLEEKAIQEVSSGKSLKDVHEFVFTNVLPIRKEIAKTAQLLAQGASEREAKAYSIMNKKFFNLIEALALFGLSTICLVIWAAYLLVKVDRHRQIAIAKTVQTSQARKEIVEVVAHDVKSPISTILMAVDLLKESIDLNSNDVRETVDVIERSASAANRLVVDLLDHAKIESGNFAIDVQTCDLGLLVEKVATRFKLLAQAKKIHLHLEHIHEKTLSNCDSARIDQVLSNLLSNAIKFSPVGGSVTLSCVKSENQILISVEDSGHGLSQEQIPHIFDRYWQVRKVGQQGTGLGLAIAKSIINAHQGDIWVESQRGTGTRFFVSLPAMPS